MDFKILVFGISALVLAGCSSTTENARTAQFQSATVPGLTGAAKLMPGDNLLKLHVHVKGLEPGSTHGMHIHENGLCQGPDYKSAGDHFNPHKTKHGGPNDQQRHIGDFGNLKADATGTIKQDIVLKGFDPAEMESLLGKAVILHAKADDLKTQPTGDSGDRLACGLIQ